MNKPKVIVTRKWPDVVEQRLAELFDVQLNLSDQRMDAGQLREALRSADAVCPTVSDHISSDVLNVEPLRCKILGNFGVGFNHIDVTAAKKAGLLVTNTPGVLTDCTADLTMMLILMVARRAGEGERLLRSGQWGSWKPTHLLGKRVAGKTLGLIGMGRIGRAVAKRAADGFGMRVIYYNRSELPSTIAQQLNASACASIDIVLREADFISLHCPGGEATRNLINAEHLALMKSSAFLINTARGDVVDEDALVEALEAGIIAGAGLDVYANEPRVPQQLLSMENVVLLPHLGSASLETRIAMGMCVVKNLQAHFSGQSVPNSIF